MNSIENIVDELFCLNFETKLFAQYVSYGKLERWIPGFSDPHTEESHITRYNFIADYVKNKVVLDIACGTGKGSLMIAQAGAAKVTGVDIDDDAVRYAQHRFPHPHLSFSVGNALDFKGDDQYDVIVSFETIEHLPDVSAFLRNVNSLLKEDGVFFVSTPISAIPLDLKPRNTYHVQEWGLKKFQEVVSEFITVDKSYLQLFPERSITRFAIYRDRLLQKSKLPYVSTISTLNEVEKLGRIAKLGKSILGYQILQCSKK